MNSNVMNDLKKLLIGPNRYTTGLIFLLANLMGFFAKMNQSNVSPKGAFGILAIITIMAYMLS